MTCRPRRARAASDGRRRRVPPRRGSARAVVLLEVVLSLSLFFGAAMVILSGLNSALRTAQRVQVEAEAADLAVSMLSEIQMGLVPPKDDGPNPYEGEYLRDWTWEIVTETYDEPNPELPLPEFLRVEVVIRNEATGYVYRISELMTEELLSQPPEEGQEGMEDVQSPEGPGSFGPARGGGP